MNNFPSIKPAIFGDKQKARTKPIPGPQLDLFKRPKPDHTNESWQDATLRAEMEFARLKLEGKI